MSRYNPAWPEIGSYGWVIAVGSCIVGAVAMLAGLAGYGELARSVALTMAGTASLGVAILAASLYFGVWRST